MVYHALKIMVEKNVSLLVIENEKLNGMGVFIHGNQPGRDAACWEKDGGSLLKMNGSDSQNYMDLF
jgi:hypothetical protein